MNPADNNNRHSSAFVRKMKTEGLSPFVIDTFSHYYNQVIKGESGLIANCDIQPVSSSELADATELAAYTDTGRQNMQRAVKIVLNGGLGTSMGLTTAKSLLEVRPGKSFLDLIVQSTHAAGVRLAFMNSYNTHADTLKALSRISSKPAPATFVQHKFPKIRKTNYAPVKWPANPSLEWNPPGHGDVYTALYTSQMLNSFLEADIEYAFICNADNLGAGFDAAILGYFAAKGFPFMMEVSPKTPADIKGGHLARLIKNNRLVLRESAQCPLNEIDTFQDRTLYGYFNTNNIWINLKRLKALFSKNGVLRLPMILNPKRVDPRNANSPRVIQVETAMGAAISLFEGSEALKVPRERFFPVKNCSDLLIVRSDLFHCSNASGLTLNPRHSGNLPTIRLDQNYYGKIDQLEKRFPHGAPSLLRCRSLKIKGDIHFERDVTLKGDILLENQQNRPATIKTGTIIENNIVF